MVVSKVPVSTWLCHYQHQLGNFRPVTPPSCCCCRCTEEWRIYTIKENEIHRWIHQMCSIEYRHQFIILLNREESQKVSENLKFWIVLFILQMNKIMGQTLDRSQRNKKRLEVRIIHCVSILIYLNIFTLPRRLQAQTDACTCQRTTKTIVR